MVINRISPVFLALSVIVFILLVQLQLHLQFSSQNRAILASLQNRERDSADDDFKSDPIKSKKSSDEIFLDKVTVDLEELMKGPLAQDDPRIINYIQRNKVLVQPSIELYNLSQPKIDPSMGQGKVVKQIFKDKRYGFFVECGGLDGETRSNTLDLERHFGWKGLLIEADPSNFKLLLNKHRKAWAANVCLATKEVPHQVTFMQKFNQGQIVAASLKTNSSKTEDKKSLVNVQCLPLFSLLATMKIHTVDYFSLDVEGSEFQVLQNIPFDKIWIKVLSVEYFHPNLNKPDESKVLTEFMKTKGYRVVTKVNNKYGYANDLIFAHKSVVINGTIKPIQTR